MRWNEVILWPAQVYTSSIVILEAVHIPIAVIIHENVINCMTPTLMGNVLAGKQFCTAEKGNMFCSRTSFKNFGFGFTFCPLYAVGWFYNFTILLCFLFLPLINLRSKREHLCMRVFVCLYMWVLCFFFRSHLQLLSNEKGWLNYFTTIHG